MHELEAYVSNPTALDIYLQENKGAIDAIDSNSGNVESEVKKNTFTNNDYETLPRAVRLQYRHKAQIATENYRQKQIQITTDVKRFERNLRLQFKKAEAAAKALAETATQEKEGEKKAEEKRQKRRRERGKENEEQSYQGTRVTNTYNTVYLKRRTRSLSSHRPIHELFINSK